MWQLPLHPMIVHFPIVLACLLPLVAGIIAWGLFRGKYPKRSWWIPVVMQAVIFFSAWVAVQQGEKDEERVENVVAEQVLETHEEAGNAFLTVSGILLALMVIPLFVGTRFVPIVITALSLVSLVLVYKAGHSGAQLVYVHNAAAALQTPGGQGEAGTSAGQTSPSSRRNDDDDD